MSRLTLADVKDLVAYERVRERFRAEVIAEKQRRRVIVGPRVSLLFESRLTVLSQVQEMVRVERLVDDDKIQFELDVYNELLPDPGHLSATLFVEITDADDIRAELDRFIGLDEPGHLRLELPSGARVNAVFEAGHSRDDRISAVQYVKFPITAAQRSELAGAAGEAALVVENPGYAARAVLTPALRAELARDLES
jgi:hypothetical protein